jgi:hypothetical protein
MHVEKKPTPKFSHPRCLQQINPGFFSKENISSNPPFFKKFFPPRLKPFCPPFYFENEKI